MISAEYVMQLFIKAAGLWLGTGLIIGLPGLLLCLPQLLDCHSALLLVPVILLLNP